MTGIRIRRGFAEAQRAELARLFWEAFSGKLGRIMAPDPRALVFLERALRPDFALCALDEAGRVRGAAGLKTARGGLIAAGFADLARAYGAAGALWRAPLLDLTDCPAAPDELRLDGLFVAREARGQGIGTALIEAVLVEAAARGAAEVRLEVIEDNHRARALYDKLGFVAVRQRRMGLMRAVLGVRAATTMARPIAHRGAA